jgi:hypothetical protein
VRCYQVMECDDPALLEEWMSHWRDLIDFEVVPVVTSAEAAERRAKGLVLIERCCSEAVTQKQNIAQSSSDQ